MIDTGYKPWSAGRWCAVGGMLVAMHVVLIANFGRPVMNAPALEIPNEPFVLLPPHSTDLREEWIPNPASYALPDAQGFSGSASRWLPRTVLPRQSRESSPVYLVSSAETPLGSLPEVKSPVRSGTAANPAAKLPVELPTVVSSRTTMVYGTAVKSRVPNTSIVLPPWQGDGLPSPTRVEFALNPLGEVMLVRLMESSKSKTMDALALSTVGSLRFRPLPGGEVADAQDTKLFTWSTAAIFWAPATPETR